MKQTKTELKTTWSKDSSDYSRTFQMKQTEKFTDKRIENIKINYTLSNTAPFFKVNEYE